jgi:hypothetical protein
MEHEFWKKPNGYVVKVEGYHKIAMGYHSWGKT